MQRNALLGMMACLVVVIALLCWQQRPTAAADKTPKEAAAWEYKIVSAGSPAEVGDRNWQKILNTQGNQGWELVQPIRPGTNEFYFFFKRPKSK